MAYIGLLRADESEPSAANGYTRIPEAEIAIFPDSINEGYGEICAVAFFDARSGGAALRCVTLSGPVNVHAGVTPIYKGGKLLRGVSACAEIICGSEEGCKVKEVNGFVN